MRLVHAEVSASSLLSFHLCAEHLVWPPFVFYCLYVACLLNCGSEGAGIVWDGWGCASARPQTGEASGGGGAAHQHPHASGADRGSAQSPIPYMQLAAVCLAPADARAHALCLLEAQLLSDGAAAAQQVVPLCLYPASPAVSVLPETLLKQ